MKLHFWIVTKKELYTHLHSALFYALSIFFLLFTSVWLFYVQQYFSLDTASLRPYFAAFPLALTLVIPALTMKSWAEERRLGSIELLYTMPFSEWDLTLGKWTASLLLLALMLAFTLPLPLSMLSLGDFDAGVIVSEYAGAFLLCASAAGLGQLLSVLAKNQAAAFIGTAAALIVFMFANRVSDAFNAFSLSWHFESFAKGVLDSRDLFFFILSAALFLYLNTQVLILRKGNAG